MPAPRLKTPPDDIIRKYMAQNWTEAEIAASCGISQPTAHDHIARIRRIDAIADAAKQTEVVEKAVASVFNYAEQMEHQYERVERYIRSAEQSGADPVTIAPLLARSESLLSNARDAMAKLYEIQQIQQWQKTVLDTIGQCAPAVRDEIMLRLKQQRQVSAAFLPPSNS